MTERVVLLCATRRGLRFLKRLRDLLPDHGLDVVSFREESWEPPFVDEIAAYCQSHDLGFLEAKQVDHERFRSFWEREPTRLLLAVNWRYMVGETVLARPACGAFVFHDSLLPGYRGFSPTVWAVINGEELLGVSLVRMVAEVDAGPLVDQEVCRISNDDTIASILPRIDDAYFALLDRNIQALISGRATERPQDHSQASYTCRRLPQDNEIVWSGTTRQVLNLIRAVSRPYPGAYTWLAEARFRVWAARELADTPRYVGRVPGRVVEIREGEGVVVLTGDGCLLLTEVESEDAPPQCPSRLISSIATTLGRNPGEVRRG